MANLKIFVSSTCYDLNVVRSQLRNFLTEFGYEPVMSEYSDILFDPRQHTHTSCVQEVLNCDMVVMIIGSRYGGNAIPKAMELLDIDKVKGDNASRIFVEGKNQLSVTQLEVLRAI